MYIISKSKFILKLRDFNDGDGDTVPEAKEYFYHTLTHCCHKKFYLPTIVVGIALIIIFHT